MFRVLGNSERNRKSYHCSLFPYKGPQIRTNAAHKLTIAIQYAKHEEHVNSVNLRELGDTINNTATS